MRQILEILAWKKRDWVIITDTSIPIKTLLSYSKAYVTIKDTATSDTIKQYDLSTFDDIRRVDNELSILNFVNGYNKPLPANVQTPKSLDSVSKVTYHNLWDFGLRANKGYYSINPLVENTNYSPDIVIDNGANVNQLTAYRDKLLYLVNGYVFFEEYANNKVYLKSAGLLIDKSDRNDFSIIDFSPLRGFARKGFNDQGINSITVISRENNEVVVSIKSDTLFNNAVPLLVVNRRLYILTKNYKMYSNTEILLTLYLDDLVLANDELPVTSLDWVNPANLSDEGYNLDSVDVVKCLSNPETSAILLLDDSNDISLRVDQLFRTNLPYKYTFNYKPYGVAYLEDHTLVDYSVTCATGKYGNEITTSHNRPKKKISDTVPRSKLGVIGSDYTNFKDTVYSCFIKTLYTI